MTVAAEDRARVQPALRHVVPELLREPVQASAHLASRPGRRRYRPTPIRHAHVVHPPADHARHVAELADPLKLPHREEHTIHGGR